jgi:hypothetical protein
VSGGLARAIFHAKELRYEASDANSRGEQRGSHDQHSRATIFPADDTYRSPWVVAGRVEWTIPLTVDGGPWGPGIAQWPTVALASPIFILCRRSSWFR